MWKKIKSVAFSFCLWGGRHPKMFVSLVYLFSLSINTTLFLFGDTKNGSLLGVLIDTTFFYLVGIIAALLAVKIVNPVTDFTNACFGVNKRAAVIAYNDRMEKAYALNAKGCALAIHKNGRRKYIKYIYVKIAPISYLIRTRCLYKAVIVDTDNKEDASLFVPSIRPGYKELVRCYTGYAPFEVPLQKKDGQTTYCTSDEVLLYFFAAVERGDYDPVPWGA